MSTIFSVNVLLFKLKHETIVHVILNFLLLWPNEQFVKFMTSDIKFYTTYTKNAGTEENQHFFVCLFFKSSWKKFWYLVTHLQLQWQQLKEEVDISWSVFTCFSHLVLVLWNWSWCELFPLPTKTLTLDVNNCLYILSQQPKQLSFITILTIPL